MIAKSRPIIVHYLTEDALNAEAMLNIVVSIDGQRMTVGDAVRLGLMFQTVTGAFDFNATRIREQAPYLVDMLTGVRRALPETPRDHYAEAAELVAGLQPRSN
jgi:hypothetical protein